MKPTTSLFNLAVVAAIVVLIMSAWHPQAPAAALASAVAPASAPALVPESAQTECNTGRSIQVSGSAVVYTTPDRALIQLGVQSNGNNPDSTMNANLEEIKRVINAVRALGVESKDISTDYYLVYPVYEDYNSLVIKGYRIDNTVSITVRDVTLADDIIVAALRVGANEVQDVQFYTSELRKYRDQARELAMKAANEKSQALASTAGVQIGCVLNVSENSWYRYYGSWQGGRKQAMWTQNVVQNNTQGDMPQLGDSPVSLGQIAVQAEVSASYSLK